ncbi:hypothetical protein BVAVS116_H0135 (plasmid) [Borreliella valaisiana VS116]|uniref:Uncharacterized protein n=1 Tax=Borreliella valaisiana VS116 TaxID=445987 RepID=C0R950_BORVA|nr:hypothetical protein BVAVS116_H0135 [Borreliella valaisiana VS116]
MNITHIQYLSFLFVPYLLFPSGVCIFFEYKKCSFIYEAFLLFCIIFYNCLF